MERRIQSDMQRFRGELGELKAKSITTSFAISYVTSRLLIGRAIIKETHRNWKYAKVTGAFLDYLNFTLPCGDDCPLHFAQPQGCHMSDDLEKLYMNFIAPTVSNKLTLVEADPFKMYLRKGNKTCTIEYSGPTSAILSESENCLYGLNVKQPTSHDLIVSPSRGCKPHASFSKDARYFVVSRCEKSLPQDFLDFIQIKPHNGLYYINCKGNFSIEGRQEPCPEDVFTLPITAGFQINEYGFEGSSMSLVHDEGIDAMFTVRTNWHLRPFVNWTHLSHNIEALTAGETEEPEMTEFHFMFLGTSAFIVTVFLIVVVLTLCVVCKRRVVYTTRAEAVPLEEVHLDAIADD